MVKTHKNNSISDFFPDLKRVFIISLSLFTFHFSFSQELEKLIEVAMENNPEVQKFELQYQISTEKVNEVNTIPNTEFGVGYFVSEPETRTGAQKAKFSVNQMLPWFGGITARENYVNSLSDANYEDIVITKRKLVALVSKSYYNLYSIQSKQRILIENIKLLKSYESLALVSVEVGNASVIDVLRLQMRQNELQQLKQILEQNYIAEQTLFNKLLNRNKSIEIELVDELSIQLDEIEFSFEKLKLHPELVKYDKIYQSVEESELLNQKDASPMIGFGMDYIIVEKRPDMDFSDNGKDIFMPMISVSIPIFNKKYSSQTKQNRLKQQEITFQKQNRQNNLETALEKALSNRKSAIISSETQNKNLRQAKNAEEILLKGYETGTIDFDDVLDIQELQLKFQINQIESIKNYFIQTTIINYLSS